MMMDKRPCFLRKGFPLVAFLFLIPLACTFNTAIPAAPGGINPDSAGSGTTRKNPLPPGTLISIPGWDIEVRKFVRGEAALNLINTTDWQAEPLPPGQEYALAKLFLRCTALDTDPHSLGISELFITGSSNVAYGDTMDSWPQPEFLFEDMYTAEAVEGWIDAVIPAGEQNLMVVLDVEEDSGRFTRFLALEAGASISLPAELTDLRPNDLGVNISNPAPSGQPVISPDWEITVLNSIRGSEAETILGEDNSNYAPPEAGLERLLLQVRLRYFNPSDIPIWVGRDQFYALDGSGYKVEGEHIYTPTQSDRIWLSETILPGAELEGWVALYILAGTDPVVFAFDPDYYTSEGTGQNLRYLAIR
jgi:hypothetical protein